MMSESWPKESAFASILRNTDHGFFCRLLTTASMPFSANISVSALSISLTMPPDFCRNAASRAVTVR